MRVAGLRWGLTPLLNEETLRGPLQPDFADLMEDLEGFEFLAQQMADEVRHDLPAFLR